MCFFSTVFFFCFMLCCVRLSHCIKEPAAAIGSVPSSFQFSAGLRPGTTMGELTRLPRPRVGSGRGHPLPMPFPIDAFDVRSRSVLRLLQSNCWLRLWRSCSRSRFASEAWVFFSVRKIYRAPVYTWTVFCELCRLQSVFTSLHLSKMLYALL